jgi:hypothetical protein
MGLFLESERTNTLLADSVCKFLITASAYVLMVGSETFLSVVCPSGPFPTIFVKLSFPTPGAPVTEQKSLAQNAVPGETDEAAPGDVDEGGSDTKDPYPNPDHWDHPDHPDHKSGRLEDMVRGRRTG